ncbi:hypothetical protein CRU98_00785 [Arcobacter sp. CECT 8986]|uniref:hypothetical protein n=1 Tax=Arcobacter sp. CECT 8986 TaxID=2044507 RepID=UPI001009995A|nr:hypothetical protein [Arcobacter sp. CECT 8986]RXK01020.1 hypothetical protein CRU98_00785 [Arcobacter sp. CECT 8986]
MVKILIFSLLFFNFLNANIYEKNCVSCHKDIPVSIDKYFYRYLLKYSSEENVKKAMFSYMKNPTKKTTIMPEAFILRFKLKEPTKLSDKELKEAIDIYWEKYKVFGKLK